MWLKEGPWNPRAYLCPQNDSTLRSLVDGKQRAQLWYYTFSLIKSQWQQLFRACVWKVPPSTSSCFRQSVPRLCCYFEVVDALSLGPKAWLVGGGYYGWHSRGSASGLPPLFPCVSHVNKLWPATRGQWLYYPSEGNGLWRSEMRSQQITAKVVPIKHFVLALWKRRTALCQACDCFEEVDNQKRETFSAFWRSGHWQISGSTRGHTKRAVLRWESSVCTSSWNWAKSRRSLFPFAALVLFPFIFL